MSVSLSVSSLSVLYLLCLSFLVSLSSFCFSFLSLSLSILVSVSHCLSIAHVAADDTAEEQRRQHRTKRTAEITRASSPSAALLSMHSCSLPFDSRRPCARRRKEACNAYSTPAQRFGYAAPILPSLATRCAIVFSGAREKTALLYSRNATRAESKCIV